MIICVNNHDDHCDPSNYDVSWTKYQDDQYDPDVFRDHNDNDDLCDPIDPNDLLQ